MNRPLVAISESNECLQALEVAESLAALGHDADRVQREMRLAATQRVPFQQEQIIDIQIEAFIRGMRAAGR